MFFIFLNKIISLFSTDLLSFPPKSLPSVLPLPPCLLPSVFFSRYLHLQTLQPFSLHTFRLLWRKPVWRCGMSSWLMLSMRWGRWAGISIVLAAPFFCQGAEPLPWGQGWRWPFCLHLQQSHWLPRRQKWAFKGLPANPADVPYLCA